MRLLTKNRLEKVLGFDNIPSQSFRLPFSLYVLYGNSRKEFDEIDEKQRVFNNQQGYLELCRFGAMSHPVRFAKEARQYR